MVWSIGMADNGKKKSQSPPNRTSEATNKYVGSGHYTYVQRSPILASNFVN